MAGAGLLYMCHHCIALYSVAKKHLKRDEWIQIHQIFVHILYFPPLSLTKPNLLSILSFLR